MNYDIKKFDIEYQLPNIKYDLSDLKENIEKVKQEYSDFTVSNENIPKAKKLKSKLNKLVKEINRKRIDISKVIKQPITDFESEIKDLTKEIETVSVNIKNQLDEFDNATKEKKKQEILNHDLWQDYMLFNEKWLNKSFSMKDIEKEMKLQEQNYSNNALLIATTCQNLELNSEKYLEMLTNHKNIQEIIELINNDKQVKNEYLDRQTEIEEIDTQEMINDIKEETKNQTKITYTLKLVGTVTQLKALKQFIVDNGIEYEKVGE